MKSPTIDLTVAVPKAVAFGYLVDNISSDMTYSNKMLYVHTLNFMSRSGAGAISAGGFIDTSSEPANFRITGEARSIDIDQLPLPPSVRQALEPLSVTASAVFDATPAAITAKVASNAGTIRGAPFEAAEGNLLWQVGKSVTVRNFFIRQPGEGIIVASGTVPTSPDALGINVQYHAVQIDMSKLGLSLAKDGIHGLAYLQGGMTGSLKSPTFDARVYVLQPRIGKFSADVLRSTLSGSGSRITVSSLRIRRVPGTLSASGEINAADPGKPSFDLDVSLTDLPVSYVAALNNPLPQGGFPLSGFISGKARLTGTAANPLLDAGEIPR